MNQRCWHDGTTILDSILKKFHGEPGKFLGVGANVGNDWSWPLLAQGWTGVLVEPDPFACSNLIDNCQQWKDQVVIVNSAMSSTTGLDNFYVSRKSSWNSSLDRRWQLKMMDLNASRDKNDQNYVYKILTNTITMKDLVGIVGSEFRVVVIDTEGMDSKIVLSTDWNHFRSCELICIEHEFAEIEPHQDIIQYLKSFGFIFTDQDNAHAVYQKSKSF